MSDYEKARIAHLSKVKTATFPTPRHDQESDVSLMMKHMLVNQLVNDAFRAGWEAAGKKVPK